MSLLDRVKRVFFGESARREPSDVQVEARIVRNHARRVVTQITTQPRDWRDTSAMDMYSPRRKETQ